MKAKNIILIVCCIVISAFVLGATGAIKLEGDAESPGPDRLIGVFITREYLDLFDAERFFNDNAGALAGGGEIANSDKYQGRLYADTVETSHTNDETGEVLKSREYVFPGVDGIRFFAPYISDESGSYHSATTDEGITDGAYHFQSTDDGESVSLTGTIFVASQGVSGTFYINPVYQSPSGEVYAVAGEGIFYDAGNEGSYSTKISENREAASGGTSTSSGTEVEVTVCVMDEPTGIALLQFNGKDELLSRTEYRPGTLPEHIDALSDTQYIIMEASSPEGIRRTLFQSEDAFVYAFYRRADGICLKQECEIGWTVQPA